MPDCLVELVLLSEPLGRAEQRRRCRSRIDSIELQTKHIPEEVVAAVPPTIVVERYDEDVGFVELLEYGSGARTIENPIA